MVVKETKGRKNTRDFIRLLENDKTFEQKFYFLYFCFSHTATILKHMGFLLISPICIKMCHVTAVFEQLHRQRDGND